jgi:hypothetical protein
MSQDLEKEPFGEEHFEEVQSFRCGSLPHQVEVSDWLKRPMGEDGALTAIHDPQKPNRVWLWAGEKLVLTELEGRFRDACFCCARWNDVASERSLSPPCEGGQ